jgi:hypothetical protein
MLDLLNNKISKLTSNSEYKINSEENSFSKNNDKVSSEAKILKIGKFLIYRVKLIMIVGK